MPNARDPFAPVRTLVTIIALLLGVIIALLAGILRHMEGKAFPEVIEYSAASFAASVLLIIGVVTFWTNFRHRDL